MADYFTEELSQSYDEKNRKLAPIAQNMHFLLRLVLKPLPRGARILCVGVGTGAEILSLAEAYPDWSFVGVDPSAPMLEVCRARLGEAGIMPRCELVRGYVQDVPPGEHFDAAVSLLVGHFVPRAERPDFYRQMHQRLKPGGYLASTEISADMDAPDFPSLLEGWGEVQALMGGTAESLQRLPAMLREALHVLPPSEVEACLRAGGVATPVRFFQALMIVGWFGRKS